MSGGVRCSAQAMSAWKPGFDVDLDPVAAHRLTAPPVDRDPQPTHGAVGRGRLLGARVHAVGAGRRDQPRSSASSVSDSSALVVSKVARQPPIPPSLT